MLARELLARVQQTTTRLTSPLAVWEAAIAAARMRDLPIAESAEAIESYLALMDIKMVNVAPGQARHDDPRATLRILIIDGSSRSEHTCPGEMSKSWRVLELARSCLRDMGFEIDVLDLCRQTSEFGKQIHPCKSCVSTSMALCHWPCSCYPNYSLGQTDDWMNEIYSGSLRTASSSSRRSIGIMLQPRSRQ